MVPPPIPVPVLSVAVLPIGDPLIVAVSLVVVELEELFSPHADRLMASARVGSILIMVFMI
jgi:hypothetical protein